MQMKNEQRQAERYVASVARRTAAMAYFTGTGAFRRSLSFALRGLLTSTSWFARLLMFTSWAVVAGVLIGPAHDELLAKAYSWATSMPLDQLQTALHSVAYDIAIELAKISLVVGYLEQFVRVTETPVGQYSMIYRNGVTQA